MAYEQKDLNGVLFKNENKETEKHPDYKGSCLINGVECWIAAWVKDGKKGKYMSLAFQAKKEKQENKPQESVDQNSLPF